MHGDVFPSWDLNLGSLVFLVEFSFKLKLPSFLPYSEFLELLYIITVFHLFKTCLAFIRRNKKLYLLQRLFGINKKTLNIFFIFFILWSQFEILFCDTFSRDFSMGVPYLWWFFHGADEAATAVTMMRMRKSVPPRMPNRPHFCRSSRPCVQQG